MQYRLRAATHADRPALKALIERSARQLGAADYRAEQIEGALQGAFGVDTQLIDDGTYFVAELAGSIVGCGGWSHRRTLFGGDRHAQRDAEELDPHTDAAKIRAFFVDPDHARRGIGRALLERCESEALAHGFRQFELMGTLPGVRLYQALGYVAGTPVHYPVAEGVSIEFVPMRKQRS
jgi:GNAT superfamily N-acetyltransferase